MTLALVASACERISLEIRHLQRTEVGEVAEPFGKGQKGSSAMPHKRNPILTENLCGLARLVRSYAHAAMENVALWHERDISHSSVERVIGPDATIALDFMLGRLAGVVEGLEVRSERMAENLSRLGGAIYSEQVLLALVRSGVARDEAYGWIQRHALHGDDLLGRLQGDAQITAHLDAGALAALFELQHHLRHTDTLMARAFAEGDMDEGGDEAS
jgi:adenylosuccinate lyase